jgi:hypothetical protein
MPRAVAGAFEFFQVEKLSSTLQKSVRLCKLSVTWPVTFPQMLNKNRLHLAHWSAATRLPCTGILHRAAINTAADGLPTHRNTRRIVRVCCNLVGSDLRQ